MSGEKMKYKNTYYLVTMVERKKEDIPNDSKMLENQIAIPISLYEGKRGWIFYYVPDDPICEWHRVHTSIVQKIVAMKKTLVVETENTIYNLERLEDGQGII